MFIIWEYDAVLFFQQQVTQILRKQEYIIYIKIQSYNRNIRRIQNINIKTELVIVEAVYVVTAFVNNNQLNFNIHIWIKLYYNDPVLIKLRQSKKVRQLLVNLVLTQKRGQLKSHNYHFHLWKQNILYYLNLQKGCDEQGSQNSSALEIGKMTKMMSISHNILFRRSIQFMIGALLLKKAPKIKNKITLNTPLPQELK
ncbi:hypothetical protein pb186bvf_013348 [Paramecium bursaria]